MSYAPTFRRVVSAQKPKGRGLKGLGFSIDDPHRWSRYRMRRGLGQIGTSVMPLVVVGGVALIGLFVYGAYQQAKVHKAIIEKEGVAGALKYEAGRAGIGLASQWLSPGRGVRRNKRRGQRRGRRRS